MSCASCAKRIENALLAVSGVTQASVNLATETAVIHGDARYSDIAQAITSAGYELIPEQPDTAATAQAAEPAPANKVEEVVVVGFKKSLADALKTK